MDNKKPEYLDIVKHKKQKDITCIVNSNYVVDDIDYIDIELSDRNIFYKSLAENWEVVEKYNSQE